NRPAASGIVGTDATAKATPDGHTLLMVASSFAVVPATHPKLPYDAERDLAPIGMVAKNSLLFVVNPKVPANSLAQFVALAKANPGQLNYASPGAATQTHLVVELLSQKAGIKLQHIPYRAGAPDMIAKLAHQGLSPAGGTPTQFQQTIAIDLKNWTEIARAANITAE